MQMTGDMHQREVVNYWKKLNMEPSSSSRTTTSVVTLRDATKSYNTEVIKRKKCEQLISELNEEREEIRMQHQRSGTVVSLCII